MNLHGDHPMEISVGDVHVLQKGMTEDGETEFA